MTQELRPGSWRNSLRRLLSYMLYRALIIKKQRRAHLTSI